MLDEEEKVPVGLVGVRFRLALVWSTVIERVVVLTTGVRLVASASTSFRTMGWMKRAERMKKRKEAEVPRMRSLRQLVMWEERLVCESYIKRAFLMVFVMICIIIFSCWF